MISAYRPWVSWGGASAIRRESGQPNRAALLVGTEPGLARSDVGREDEGTMAPISIGIDVAKDHLDVCARPSGQAWRVANDPDGIDALALRLTEARSTCRQSLYGYLSSLDLESISDGVVKEAFPLYLNTTTMPRRPKNEPLPTIWHVPDELWHRIEPVLLELDLPFDTGAKRIDQRAALDAILYRLRTGVQWNHLPEEFPDDSSVHRTMQRWINKGVFLAIWTEIVEVCEDLGGVSFAWQAADPAVYRRRRCLGKPAPVETASAPTPPTGANQA